MLKRVVFSFLFFLCFSQIALGAIGVQVAKGKRSLKAVGDQDSRKYEGDSEELSASMHWVPGNQLPFAIGMGVTSVRDMSLALKEESTSGYVIVDDGKGLISGLEVMGWLPSFWKFTLSAKAAVNFGRISTEFSYLGSRTKTSYSIQGTHLGLGIAWGWPRFSLFAQADKAKDKLKVTETSGFAIPLQKQALTLDSLAWSGGLQVRF